MRILILCLSLFLAACASTPPANRPARDTSVSKIDQAADLTPEQAWKRGIELRDANRLKESYEYLLSAAERGNREAQFEIGLWYMTGDRGLPANFDKAAPWIERAAKQGQPDALTYIWQLYFYGRGVPQDDVRALGWLQRGAKAGLSWSDYYLGLFYYEGIATDKDHKQAAGWFQQAGAEGVPGACYYLGVMHLDGDGVEQNDKDAAYWFERGAAAGHPPSMLAMGDLYRDGRGVEKDVNKAKAWYRKAIAQDEDADVQTAGTQRLKDLK